MRRRALIGSIAGVASWPIAARAQQKLTPAIGYLSGGLADAAGAYRAAFAAGLREAGFVEGQTVTVEHRFADGRFERLPAMAADLVGRKVDVIFAGGTQATRAAKAATSTIPIVFLIGDDPVAEGFVLSLARPLGNLTGISNLLTDLAPFTADGGLISYGPSLVASIRDCSAYAGRILKGARPADLPVVQPTVFELAINLRTARTLGLAIPAALLARADDVIE